MVYLCIYRVKQKDGLTKSKFYNYLLDREAMQGLQGYIVGYLIRHKIDTKGSSIWVRQMAGKVLYVLVIS